MPRYRRYSRGRRFLRWLARVGVRMRKLMWWIVSSVLTVLVKVLALCLTPVFVVVKGTFAYAHEWSDAIVDYITNGPSGK